MRKIFAALAIFALSMSGATAAETTMIYPARIQVAIEQMIPAFEKKTGVTVNASFHGTKPRVLKGEPFDVIIIQSPYSDVLASGNVRTNTETPLAHVSVGVAVHTGIPHPDISNADAVKKLLLNAKAISYPDPKGGAYATGVSIEASLKKLGVADQVSSKVKLAQGDAGAMAMLAKGEVDVGLALLSEIKETGVEVVGPLPESISTPMRLSGFVGAHTTNEAVAKQLLEYLSSADGARSFRELGLVPGR